MKDVLGEAMDLEGLKAILDAMHSGRIQCVAIDTTTPSVFSHELLNANPYAFLDDAGLEERRARAVQLRGVLPDSQIGEAGRLSPDAIAEVRESLWPDIRDEHELHDLLCSLVLVPAALAADSRAHHWDAFFSRLEQQRRATIAHMGTHRYFVVAERISWLKTLCPEVLTAEVLLQIDGEIPSSEDILKKSIQGWMNLLGPVTSSSLAGLLGVSAAEIWKPMLRLEMSGTILRGNFEYAPSPEIADEDIEWCERRILQRIHKRTLGTLRKQIEPVTPASFLRFLFDWQHLGPQRQLTGEHGLLEALRGLEGFEAPAIEWEKSILPQRVAGYDPRWLDTLCLTGIVGWGRLSPHPAFASIESGGPRRVIPTSMAPITFFLREEALWLDLCLSQRQIPEANLTACLSGLANRVRSCLPDRGAIFASDLARMLAAPEGPVSSEEVSRALWELVAAGLITADGFDSLRLLIDPRRDVGRRQSFAAPSRAGLASRPAASRQKSAGAAGRWSLLIDPHLQPPHPQSPHLQSEEETSGQRAARQEAQIESACHMLLRRYGVVFRDVIVQETAIPRWRDLLGIFRRLEACGIVRGGRFVSGSFGGEQFALPEAVEALRANRSRSLADMPPLTIAAADPANLIGSIIPGERPICIAGNTVTFPLPESVTVTETVPLPLQNILLPLSSAARPGGAFA
jgi:ATP-dependent helicase Lhr and Lhr-like helicase